MEVVNSLAVLVQQQQQKQLQLQQQLSGTAPNPQQTNATQVWYFLICFFGKEKFQVQIFLDK